jgi:hypothetical protein
MAAISFSLIHLAEEADDGLGTFVAGSTDGVPRKPVHGGHGTADAAIHAFLLLLPPPPSGSATAMMLTTSCSPLPFGSGEEGIRREWNGERGSQQDGVLASCCYFFFQNWYMRWLLTETIRGIRIRLVFVKCPTHECGRSPFRVRYIHTFTKLTFGRASSIFKWNDDCLGTLD